MFLNSSLNGLSFAQDADGNWGYKVGADSVVPFKSGRILAHKGISSNNKISIKIPSDASKGIIIIASHFPTIATKRTVTLSGTGAKNIKELWCDFLQGDRMLQINTYSCEYIKDGTISVNVQIGAGTSEHHATEIILIG